LNALSKYITQFLTAAVAVGIFTLRQTYIPLTQKNEPLICSKQ
jgi:hypothetical protein